MNYSHLRSLVVLGCLASATACGDGAQPTDTASSATSGTAASSGSGGEGGTGAASGSGGAGGATGAGGASSTVGAGGAGGATVSTGAGGAGPSIGPGPYNIAYSATAGIGIDQRANVTATFEGVVMTGYVAGANEAPTIGTNTAAEAGADGTIVWGRWHDGTTGGTMNGNLKTFGVDEGWHYVIATQPVLPLVADETYATLLGATAPTAEDATLTPAQGSISGVTVALVTAATAGGVKDKVALEATVHLPDGDVLITMPGGLADPAQNDSAINASGTFFASPTFSGGRCAAGCGGGLRGVVSGAPRRVGFVFVFTPAGGKQVRGAVALAP